MSSLANSEWVMWLSGIGLLVAAVALVFVAWWALFSDRSAGKRRCPKCWYDMSHSPGATCGECGYTARSEQDLQRRRTRPAIAVLAMVGCAFIGGYVIDRANTRGWLNYLPTSSVIWLMPLSGSPSGAIMNELDRRIATNDLSNEQWLDLLRRCAAGDMTARPPGDAWQEKYGQSLVVWLNRPLSQPDEQFQARVAEILLTIPPRIELTSRRRWPVGVRPVIDVRVIDWWPRGAQMRITATPKIPDAVPDVHLRRRRPIQNRSYSIFLPPLAPDEHEVDIEIACERKLDEAGAWEQLGSHVQTLAITVEPPLEEVLTAVTNEDLDELVRRTFTSFLVKYRSGSLSARVGLDVRHTYVEAFDDTAVAVRIDVLRNGQLARQLDIWWVGGAGAIERQHAWEVPWYDDTVLGPPLQEEDEWSLVVRGLPELAMRVKDVDRYWAGEMTINHVPVREQDGAAPSMGWIPQEPARDPQIPSEGAGSP